MALDVNVSPSSTYQVVKGAINSEQVGKIMAAFDSNIDPLISITASVAFLVGIVMAAMSLKKLYETTRNNPQAHYGGVVTTFFIAAVLVNLPAALGTMRETMFGNEHSVLSYQSTISGVSAQASSTLVVIMHFIQFVGLIAFIRGFLILNKLANGGGQDVSLGKGVTFVVSGVMAINIVITANMLAESFGLSFRVD